MRSELAKKIVVALDVSTIEDAEAIVLKLKDQVTYFKIGSILFTRCGPECVRMVKKHGCEVFLDLKYHDIPNTVSNAAVEAAKLDVWMFNLHIAGGEDMINMTVEKVSDFCSQNNTRKSLILGVTLLTSINNEILKNTMMVNKSSHDYIKTLAIKGKNSGLDGIVASPNEVDIVRKECGEDFIILTPGIRPTWASTDDQKRLSTPRNAVERGANYLVIGRPIIKAQDPLNAFNKILDELD